MNNNEVRNEIITKKVFLGIFTFLACNSAFANGNSLSLETAEDGKTVSTFYGSKASSSANNPCKGATIRKCGTIETSLVSFMDGQTFVIQQVKDAEGNTLSTTNYISPVSVSETKSQVRFEAIKRGGVVEENIEE